MVGRKLRLITGWALVAGAIGIFVDSWASWSLDARSPEWLVSIITPGGPSNGSIGLIPAYIGATVGMLGFVVVLYKRHGIRVALVAGVGVIAMYMFWYSYPARATFGGIGDILVGVSVLVLPLWWRLASPFWVSAGVLGIPELVRPGIHWGPIASFTLLGAAIGVTGAFVLWGLDRPDEVPKTPQMPAMAKR